MKLQMYQARCFADGRPVEVTVEPLWELPMRFDGRGLAAALCGEARARAIQRFGSASWRSTLLGIPDNIGPINLQVMAHQRMVSETQAQTIQEIKGQNRKCRRLQREARSVVIRASRTLRNSRKEARSGFFGFLTPRDAPPNPVVVMDAVKITANILEDPVWKYADSQRATLRQMQTYNDLHLEWMKEFTEVTRASKRPDQMVEAALVHGIRESDDAVTCSGGRLPDSLSRTLR